MTEKLAELKRRYEAEPNACFLPSTNDLVLEFDLTFSIVRRIVNKVWTTAPRFPRSSTTRVRRIQAEGIEDEDVHDPDMIFLLLDQFSAHVNDVVVTAAKHCNVTMVFVPAGMTSELQPLDVGVNSVLKSKHSKRFRQFVFCDIGATYKPAMALSDLKQITTQTQPTIIRSAWKKVLECAEQRVQSQIDEGSDDDNEIPLHEEDYDTMPS